MLAVGPIGQVSKLELFALLILRRDMGLAPKTHAQDARGRVSGSKTVIGVVGLRIYIRIFER